VGVVLLSESYLESGNCMHELEHMVAQRDAKKLELFPVKLSRDDKLKLPSFIENTQYLRFWEHHSSAAELVDTITTLIMKRGQSSTVPSVPPARPGA
jgi:hypothetical protein